MKFMIGFLITALSIMIALPVFAQAPLTIYNLQKGDVETDIMADIYKFQDSDSFLAGLYLSFTPAITERIGLNFLLNPKVTVGDDFAVYGPFMMSLVVEAFKRQNFSLNVYGGAFCDLLFDDQDIYKEEFMGVYGPQGGLSLMVGLGDWLALAPGLNLGYSLGGINMDAAEQLVPTASVDLAFRFGEEKNNAFIIRVYFQRFAAAEQNTLGGMVGFKF